MTATESSWTGDVISFLSRNLMAADNPRDGWRDLASSAYQMACEALVALGQATRTNWGAARAVEPALPDVLPRWDDICAVVVNLASQQGFITGVPTTAQVQVGSFKITIPDRPRLDPNFEASAGLGAMIVAADAVSVFQSLGLATQRGWTAEAETIFWRCGLGAGSADFLTDPRFTTAAENAFASIPADVAAEIRRLVTITDEDVQDSIARRDAWLEEQRRRFGSRASVRATPDERIRESLEFLRRNELDWIFFRRWRLPDGWLTPGSSEQALGIFHDRLAIEMRCSVLARLFPEFEFASRRR